MYITNSYFSETQKEMKRNDLDEFPTVILVSTLGGLVVILVSVLALVLTVKKKKK